ncbi:D-aminoacyl-tRNA deacylase [Paenalcaligenes niemegkensis]|uniref:D-aminoacyl-tRNA deacylase n=1 Tax=Paenalcaligenes niemegkensis TaxID=2895469 RepID=UPI001EE98F06|nr:D-aminoacyl-tRNA deacylase [Paenalcaligenes niemegkensis]MCQ9616093.1 D-aminoacyl-tRNA deacylase [Paenalcaligenes niemegkensis]
MLAVVQRVRSANVEVSGERIASIGQGLLVLVCAEPDDTPATADALLAKLLKLRIFNDAEGKMNDSLQQLNGGLLLVSQFTLAADTSRGNRPGFTKAAPPDLGRFLFNYLVAQAKQLHNPVEAGLFGADMQVALINDGPVTIPLSVRIP